MSLYTIARRLTGLIPETPLALAQETVVESLRQIYDQTDWSFQKSVSGWLAPGMLFSGGTFTTTPYSNQVVADAFVTSALLAYTSQPLITQLQFRNPNYSVYNIIGYDNGQTPGQGNYPFATLTLDRPWMEPTSGPGQPYLIYQVYFPAPVKDFRKFVEIRDTTDASYIDFWSRTQADLAIEDPQRTVFSDPLYAVPAGVDQRPGSATLGYQMFELWPHQSNYVPYTFTYRHRGPVPQAPSDFLTMTPPYPITEKMVEWHARELLCQYKEAQKDQTTQRGAGANWILLSQMANKQFAYLFGQALAIDLNLDGESMSRIPQRGNHAGLPFATMQGRLQLRGYPDN